MIGAAFLLNACGGGGSTGTSGSTASPSTMGTLSVSMTDAPACGFDQVNVTVSKVRVHTNSGADADDTGWKDIALEPAKKINLLELTNGFTTELGETTLQTGQYTQMRLVLAANGGTAPYANSVVQSGTTAEVALETPSALQSGIKLNKQFEVAADEETELVLDFDACKSIVKKGNGGFLLKPVISVITKTGSGSAASGSINGYLNTGLVNPVVSVQQNGVVLKSTIADSNGAFTLSPVPASTGTNYTVVITADGRTAAAITGVPVTSGVTTALSTSTAPVALQTSTMHTVNGTVTPFNIGGTVRALQTLTSSGEKIEVAYQTADAVTGVYSLSLPSAAPLVGAYGTLPVTFSADTAASGKYVIEGSASGYLTQNTNVDISTSAKATANFTLTQ
jgi:hypothetical protein